MHALRNIAGSLGRTRLPPPSVAAHLRYPLGGSLASRPASEALTGKGHPRETASGPDAVMAPWAGLEPAT
jgi:hypothetical protein